MFTTAFLPSSVGTSRFASKQNKPLINFYNNNNIPGQNFFSGYSSENLAAFSGQKIPLQKVPSAWPFIQGVNSAPIDPVSNTVYQKSSTKSALMNSVNTTNQLENIHNENRSSVVYQTPVNTGFKFDPDTGSYISSLVLPPLTEPKPTTAIVSKRPVIKRPASTVKLSKKKKKTKTIFD